VTDNKPKGDDICAYKRPTDYPSSTANTKSIQVDTRNEVVFCPINSIPVPFHIGVIKSVNKSGGEDGQLTFTSIIFNTPNTVSTKTEKDLHIAQQITRNGDATFISELTFKSKNKTQVDHNVRLIKELQKRIRQREVEKANRAAVPVQEALIINRRTQIPRLSDLKMRPQASGRKSNGILEAHENGFRFTTHRGEKIDILYGNIKHALHQPADRELIVLIHFHLKFPIMVGKKKQFDIQFYSEIGDLAGESLDQARGSAWDPDEIEAEQREREYRMKLNREYADFVKKVENKPGVSLEFDIPYADLAFDGVPFRESVQCLPTVNTVCALITTPFFVLSLDEVEIAHFERIETGTALRTFDMVFVFKDYGKTPHRITSVDSAKFDQIKNWLTQIDIKYYEGPATLNWNKILGHIQKNMSDFVEDGGWDSVLGIEDEGEEGDEEDPEEGDSDFAEVDSESEDEESDDEDEGVEEEEEDEDEDESDEEDDEERGMSWEELEQKAQREDKQRDREERDEDVQMRKGGGKKSKHDRPMQKSSKPFKRPKH